MAQSYVANRYPDWVKYRIQEDRWSPPGGYQYYKTPQTFYHTGYGIQGIREYLYSWKGCYPANSPGFHHVKHECHGFPSGGYPRAKDFLPYWLANQKMIEGSNFNNACMTSQSLGDLVHICGPEPTSLAAAHYDALFHIQNGCLDKQLDGAVTATESPGFIDAAKNISDWNKSLLKKIADIHLLNVFGIQTMAQDLLGLYKALDQVPKKLYWLELHDKKPVKVNFATQLEPASCHDIGKVYGTRAPYMKIVDRRHKYRASATVVYDINKLSIRNATLKWEVWKKELGLVNPLTFIWEKIPFSFLIDYLVNIGDILGRIGEYPLFHNVEYLRQSYSILTKQDTSFYTKYVNRVDKGEYRLQATVHSESFYRSDKIPIVSVMDTLAFSLPSFNQSLNALALTVGLTKD